MAITTTNGKLAIMEWGLYWEPGLPMVSTSTIDQADQQQLLWGVPEVLWNPPGGVTVFVRIVGDAFRIAGPGGLAALIFWLTHVVGVVR